MNVDVVGGTDQGRFAKVCAAREKRVEGLEVRVVRVVIAARHICFQAEPWFEQEICECKTHVRCGRPGANVATPESAELIDKFEIVIPIRLASPNSAAKRVAEFTRGSLIEGRVPPIQAQIIKVKVRSSEPRGRRHSIQAPKLLIR